MKGSRVQSIIRELRGEKIDIVQYSEDVGNFVLNALNPAKVNRVQILDSEARVLEVVVDDEQLSLAIGKKGQNVRLASRLVGWKIDIKSEQEKKREVEAEMERKARDAREMGELQRIGEKTVQRLLEAGVRSLDAIADLGVEGLIQIQGVGPKTAEKILAAAGEGLETRAREEEAARLLAEQEAAARAAEQAAAEQAAAEQAAAEQAAAEQAAAEQAAEEAARIAAEAGGGADDSDVAGAGRPDTGGQDTAPERGDGGDGGEGGTREEAAALPGPAVGDRDPAGPREEEV
jgi:N utilization substance protein A